MNWHRLGQTGVLSEEPGHVFEETILVYRNVASLVKSPFQASPEICWEWLNTSQKKEKGTSGCIFEALKETFKNDPGPKLLAQSGVLPSRNSHSLGLSAPFISDCC